MAKHKYLATFSNGQEITRGSDRTYLTAVGFLNRETGLMEGVTFSGSANPQIPWANVIGSIPRHGYSAAERAKMSRRQDEWRAKYTPEIVPVVDTKAPTASQEDEAEESQDEAPETTEPTATAEEPTEEPEAQPEPTTEADEPVAEEPAASQESGITAREYGLLQSAYDFFNARLFGGQLHECLIVLHRHRGAAGYYRHNAFRSRADGSAVPELSLCPETFAGRSDQDILSTLVHEMAHVWQFAHGDPSRNGYHNRQFAEKMEEIGLMASSTGQPGGKKTGQRMSHYIIPDGPFDRQSRAFLEDGSRRIGFSALGSSSAGSSPRSKVAYCCPTCDLKVWGKPGLRVVCGECDQELEEWVG